MKFLQLWVCLVAVGCLGLLLRGRGRYADNLAAADERRWYQNNGSLEGKGTSGQPSLYWQDHEALARKDPTRKRSDAATRGVPIDGTLHKGAKKPYPSRQNPSEGRICGTAVLQGRRMSQEDRVVCIPDIRLQFFDDEQAHLVSLLAVFDGHFGHDASELAATSIYPRFLYHLYSIIGELASTACINYVDACPTKITGEGINGRKSEPIHGNSFSIYACSEKRANFSGLLLPEECHGRKATAMQDLLSITNAAGFSPATTTVWHTAFSHWSDVDVEDQFHEQEWSKMDLQSVRSWAVSGKMESSLLRTILKQALQNAMFEIDRVFSTEAEKKGSGAGSTACVMLHAEEYLLIANLGDSKAFMCSSATSCSSHVQLDECQENLRVCERKRQTSGQGPSASLEGDTSLCSQELTSDHRPDRDDERKRVVEAGGFIENTGGVPRVNGQLAVTRSIGDVALKRFGIIAQPEFTGWHRIAENDTLLVVASDGVFEKMTVQDVCNILYAVSCDRSLSAAIGHVIRRQGQAIPLLPNEEFQTSQADKNVVAAEAVSLAGAINQQQHAPEVAETESSHPNTFETSSSLQLKQLAVHAQASKEVHQQMAEAVVDAAFLSGSMDNVAAVVLPVVSLHHLSSDKCSELQSRSTYKTRNVHGSGELLDAKGIASTSAEQEHKETGEKVTTQCYQLMKTLPRQVLLPLLPVSTTMETNLPETREVIHQAATTHNSHIHASRKAPLVRQNEGRSKFELDVYREHLVCTSRQAVLEPHNEVCPRPEGLSAFLSLIGSVPLDYLSLPASDRDSILGGYHDSSVLPPYMVHHNRYMLQQKFAKGGFGEIWLGVKRLCVPEGGELSTFNMLQPEKQGNRSDGIWGDNFDTPNHDNEETYIFKRIRVEKGSKAYLSGYRERHFGEIFLNSSLELLTTSRQGRSTEDLHFLAASGSVAKRCRCCINGEQTSAEEVVNCGGSRHQHSPDRVTDSVPTRNHANLGDEGLKHIARYIEAIERPALQELWLVFRNEGQSLSKLLYVADGASSQSTGRSNMAGGFKVLRPSPWWKWLKSTEAGRKEMRNLLRQLLLAVHACSTRNITHRDIKPENMIVKSINLANQLPNGEWPSNLTMRIIDFGSAIDPFTLRHLYDSSGPSQDEQTAEYAPPEALLGKHWLQFHADKAQVYDLWSVGVVMLELVLGTPHVFQISARTRALLDQRLDGWDTTAKETAYKLRAFMELCILPQGVRPHRHHRQRDKTWDHSDEARLASFECSEAAFTQHIKQRDPLGMGMPDMSALRLVRRLLEWYPEDRISAFEALQHPYFNNGDQFP